MGFFDYATREQQEQALNWFMHRITPDARSALEADLPRVYRALTGDEVTPKSGEYFRRQHIARSSAIEACGKAGY